MSEPESWDELLDWIDELLAVNSDPDVDLDGDDDEVAVPWDLMGDWELDGEDGDDGDEEDSF
jgi:hypothetical protein